MAGVLGLWDAPASEPGKEHVTIAVSGAHGGHTVDFRELAHRGITLVGLTESFAGEPSPLKIISSKTFASAMKTIWRCWMPPMLTSPPMARIYRKSPPHGNS